MNRHRRDMRHIILESGRNIANLDAVVNFVNSAIERVPENTRENPNNHDNIVKWLKTNLRNWLINDYPNVTRITKAVNGLPDWIYVRGGDDIQGFLDANEIYMIDIRHAFAEEVGHLVDYLVANTRPGQNLSKWPVPDAMAKSKKWGVSDSDDDGDAADEYDDTGPGVKTVLKMGQWRWVKISPSTDKDYPVLAKALPRGTQVHSWTMNSANPVLRRETYFMRHCIGTGPYDNSKGFFYSLRSPSNVPKVTIEMRENGDIGQIQGIRNQPPESKYAPAIAALFRHIPFSAKDSNYLTRIGLMVIGKDVLSADDITELSMKDPQKLIELGITTKQLHDMKMFKVGNIIRKMEDIPNMTREELANSDLTDEQLKSAGYTRMADGSLKGWDDMKPGDIFKSKQTFHNMVADVKFANGLVFPDGLSFYNYPGKTFPKASIIGTSLDVTNCRNMAVIPDDVKLSGNISIKNTPLKKFPKNQTINSLALTSTDIEVLDHINVNGNATFNGTSVHTIKHCVFHGDFVAEDSNVAVIDADNVFMKSVILKGCKRLKEFNVRKVGHVFDATGSGLTSLPDGFEVGGNTEGNVISSITRGRVNLDNTPIKSLPRGMKCYHLRLNGHIKELPDDIEAHVIWIHADTVEMVPIGAKVDLVRIVHFSGGKPISTIDLVRDNYEADDDEMDDQTPKFTPGEKFHIPEDYL